MQIALDTWVRLTASERADVVNHVLEVTAPHLFALPEQHQLIPSTFKLPRFGDRRMNIPWILIPSGRFLMGLSEEEELAARRIEDPPPMTLSELRPVHPEEVESFLVTETPITSAVATQFLGALADEDDRPRFTRNRAANPAYLDREEATRIAGALGGMLPTEAQWEYVCRAGTTTLFHFGNELPEEEAELVPLVSGDLEKCLPNAFGLRGLFVGEWCSDRFRADFASPPEENSFVVRGGASVFYPWQGSEWVMCASAMRQPSRHLMDDRRCAARVVLRLPSPPKAKST